MHKDLYNFLIEAKKQAYANEKVKKFYLLEKDRMISIQMEL